MKGVIFTEFCDMVRNRFGLEMLDAIISDIDSQTQGAFTAVGTYPDQEMYDLVEALSRRSKISFGDLLREYGRSLFARLASQYPAQIEHASDSLSLLETLEDVIHPSVQKLYSDAILPSFISERISENTLVMHYSSQRQLSDLAFGLIEGCAEWFGDELTIVRDLVNADGSQAIFRLERQNNDGS